MSTRDRRIIWIDLEMTGLDPERCAIVEIATLITEDDLSVVAEGPNLVIHQPPSVLAEMAPVVVDMHTRSGLLDRIRTSTVSLADAESQTAEFIAAHCDVGKSPLAGNSIWKDREFVERYMPKVIALLHYRMIDVSTLHELVRRWYPADRLAPAKTESHRALDDIRESLDELRYYREQIFRSPP